MLRDRCGTCPSGSCMCDDRKYVQSNKAGQGKSSSTDRSGSKNSSELGRESLEDVIEEARDRVTPVGGPWFSDDMRRLQELVYRLCDELEAQPQGTIKGVEPGESLDHYKENYAW